MAKLEATVNELEFAGKVAEEHGIKEEDVTEQRLLLDSPGAAPESPGGIAFNCLMFSRKFEDVELCLRRAIGRA